MKIPWNGLYTDAWEAVIDGLLLIIAPNTSIKYDSEKEEKHLNEIKQQKLRKIEEAKAAKKKSDSGKVFISIRIVHFNDNSRLILN